MFNTPNKKEVPVELESVQVVQETPAEQPIEEVKEQEQEPVTPVVVEPAVVAVEEVKEEKVEPVVSGSIVSNVTSALGKSAPKEMAQKIASQKTVAPKQTASKFEQKIADFLNNGTTFQKMFVATLQRYVEEMKPGRVFEDPMQAFKHQRSLWDTVKNIVLTEENFIENWKMLVMFFRNNRDGALGDKYPFRFMENTPNMNTEERQAFLNLMTLLTVSGGLNNPKDVAKSVSLDRVIHRILGQEARQRVVNYYS